MYRLHKASDGLKRAPLAYYLRLTNYLQSLGLIDSSANTSLFVRNFGGEPIVLLIYVDDIVVTSNDSAALPKLLIDVGRLFAMKDLCPLQYFLEIEARISKSKLHLTQTKYI